MAGSEVDASGFGGAVEMIERLDLEIFKIHSETSSNDRTSFLRLQRFVRRQDRAYGYLEIGSHMGGSLLPHLADPHCAWVVSIDSRPQTTADERARTFDHYRENTTARMIAGLRPHLPPDGLRKLQTFDMDASAVPREEVSRPARLALIDGEHTTVAAFSDFMSLYPLVDSDAVVAYHDANLVFPAILNAERFLQYAGVPFRTVFLPDNVAAIGLRGLADALNAEVRGVALERDSYLAAARKWVWTNIAAEMVLAGELDLPGVSGISAARFKGMQDRLAAIESHPLYRASRPIRAMIARLRRG